MPVYSLPSSRYAGNHQRPGAFKYATLITNLPLPEFVKSVIFTTLFLLKETGSAS
jgi:hypothetical protein